MISLSLSLSHLLNPVSTLLLYFLLCSSSSSSPHWNPAGQHGQLSGLVHCGRRPGRGLWSVHPLVPALHALLIRLLVQTTLQCLQVNTSTQLPLLFLQGVVQTHFNNKINIEVFQKSLNVFCFVFLFLQEWQFIPVLRLLLCLHLSVWRLCDSVHRHQWLGRQVGQQDKCHKSLHEWEVMRWWHKWNYYFISFITFDVVFCVNDDTFKFLGYR